MSDKQVLSGAHVVIEKPNGESATAEFAEALRRADPSTAVRVVEAGDAQAASRVAAVAVEQGARSVAAIGGDGTINLVAAGLVGSDVPLAVGAAGTVNLLAQVLGLTTFEETADAVAVGQTRQLDVGFTSGFESAGLFVLNASSGFDAAVIADADDHGDVRFGRLHFAWAGVRRLHRDRPRRVRVTIDDQAWFDDRAMSVIVMNVGQRASASLDVAPDAAPDDGRLDVAVMRCSTIASVAKVAWRLGRGRAVDPDDVLYGQGERIDVAWTSPVPTQRDGDAGAAAKRISHTVRTRALHVFSSSKG